MDKEQVVSFSNGNFVVSPKDFPRKALAGRKEVHGDWKTSLVRKFPTMKKGQEVVVLDIWANFYGEWARIEIEGQKIDVPPDSLLWGEEQ